MYHVDACPLVNVVGTFSSYDAAREVFLQEIANIVGTYDLVSLEGENKAYKWNFVGDDIWGINYLGFEKSVCEEWHIVKSFLE